MSAQTLSAIDRFNARAARERWRTLCDDKLIFDSPKLAQLRDIWLAVRGARALPMREDFTARILGRHLQHLTFVERVEDSGTRRYRFRMFGSALARYIGDSTGKYLDEVVPENFIASVAGHLRSRDRDGQAAQVCVTLSCRGTRTRRRRMSRRAAGRGRRQAMGFAGLGGLFARCRLTNP